jgi:hypothetical protein
MKIHHSSYLLLLFAALLFSAEGTIPRKQPADYPHHGEVDGVSVGAVFLANSEVKQRFVSDLGGEYLVVEVALYPGKGGELQVNRDRFSFQIGNGNAAMRPENPQVIASLLQQKAVNKKKVAFYPQAGVGYQTGPRYDPNTGTYRNHGGLYTTAGVGVGIGDSSAASSPNNRDVMALELSEKGLPEGTFNKPVAGHLYFRLNIQGQKGKDDRYLLAYECQGKTVILPLSR